MKTRKKRTFRLIGRTTIFREESTYQAAGFILTIHGKTLDGKFETRARLADVLFVNG